MKSIDIKSVIIGILGTILVFVSIGATDKNLGDITVTSVTVVDEDGGMAMLNWRSLIIGLDVPMVGIVCEDDGGTLTTFNADGKETSYLGTAEDGSGILTIQNMEGELIAGFGSSPDNGKDGAAILFDRYGDVGWTASGKK